MKISGVDIRLSNIIDYENGIWKVAKIQHSQPGKGGADMQVEAEIVEADAVVKGQTASSSYKPAVFDNSGHIMVPPHIESGTRIVVDVYEQTCVGKAG